jgi:hypothetical protein
MRHWTTEPGSGDSSLLYLLKFFLDEFLPRGASALFHLSESGNHINMDHVGLLGKRQAI